MNKTVSVIFPYAESYDSNYGGAIARWVYEVSSRVNNTYDVTVYSASLNNNYGTVINNYYGIYCNFIKYIERQYAKYRLLDKIIYQVKRFTCRDTVWVYSLFSKLKKSDVIIIHNRPKVPSQLRKLGYKGKIILHMHNSHLYNSPNEVANALLKNVDTILFCSEFLKRESIQKFPFLSIKSKVIYNGVVSRPTKNLTKENVILFAGRIIDDKGVIELIQAFNEVKKLQPKYRLHIVGGVSSGKSLQKTTYLVDVEDEINASNYKKDISFLGHLNHTELLNKMSKSEILAVPSKWKEPFGMVALEGAVNNCKVVATSNGGMPEILGDDGYYCDCSPASIATALIRAIGDDYHSNSNIYKKFLWDQIANEFKAVLE